MAKGYWVKQVTIASTDLFIEYIQTVIPWLLSVGGVVIAKDISHFQVELDIKGILCMANEMA